MQRKPVAPPKEAPVICSSSAFVDPKDFEIPGLQSKSDKEFHAYVAREYAPKYPVLKNAYTDLLECWNHYHPKEKK